MRDENPGTEPRGFVQVSVLLIVFVLTLVWVDLGRIWRKVRKQ